MSKSRGDARRAKGAMRERSRAAAGAVDTRIAIVIGLVVVAGLGALWLGSRSAPGRDTDAASQAPADAAAAARSGEPGESARAKPAVFAPAANGTVTIPASAVASGEPIELELTLGSGEISDSPMTAQLRSGGKTYDIGVAELDPDTGKARLTIAAERLPPGQHLLAVRIPQESWNPHKRVVITVEND